MIIVGSWCDQARFRCSKRSRAAYPLRRVRNSLELAEARNEPSASSRKNRIETRALYFSSAVNSRSVERLYIGGRIAPQQEAAAATARVRAHAVCFLNNYNEGNYLARRQAECDESLLHIVARKTIARELDR